MATKHLVITPFQGWGHIRPVCTLATRIVQLDPSVTVTFFVAAMFFPLAQAEISRSFADGEDAATRIRVIALAQHENPMISATYEEAFGEAWTKIVAQEPITCVKTGAVHAPIPIAPKQVILDFFAPRTFAFIRKEAPDVKISTWYPSAAYSGFYLFGPESLGGRGNLLIKAEEEAATTGKPFDVAAAEVFSKTEGKVVRVPGLPPMYDYEYEPQVMPLPPPLVGNSFIKAHDLLLKTDAVLTMSPAALEPEEAVVAFRQWLGSLGKKVYFTGPLMPDGANADAGEKTASPVGQQIHAFLDRQMQEKGKHSVLYISFGSMFFPLNPEVFAAFLEVVMEQKIPFIVSHPSPFAVFSDELKKKVEEYGNGFFSPWSPQQTVLNHPATGWFVTHAGFNSTLEAIHAGVPLICWPFLGDQPVNTIVLAETHQVAYELLEVRTGQGLRPIFRTGKAPTGTLDAVRAEARDVLARAFGEDGAQRRARLLALKERVNESWAEGGASRKDVGAFISTLQ
ncbi:UDP-glycosyltransferase 87A1 [Trametes pubescens]|uniref:UDP-glycosyltransferase 87A1 n=1 Tax=Trametes pubescens TaxID=154538 RepID=A0A1M2VIN9_TRAPU|nr:UDP-glycosyltransferase 87A1 [Trametes pubescens]